MDISFEYYKIFYYVAKYENITKAAMVLKSSQPNVTRIIHILEDQLDCRLFLREPRGLKLTEEGKRLYANICWMRKPNCAGTKTCAAAPLNWVSPRPPCIYFCYRISMISRLAIRRSKYVSRTIPLRRF